MCVCVCVYVCVMLYAVAVRGVKLWSLAVLLCLACYTLLVVNVSMVMHNLARTNTSAAVCGRNVAHNFHSGTRGDEGKG